jgi:hypothetical protein
MYVVLQPSPPPEEIINNHANAKRAGYYHRVTITPLQLGNKFEIREKKEYLHIPVLAQA